MYFFQIFPQFTPKGPIGKKSVLYQVMHYKNPPLPPLRFEFRWVGWILCITTPPECNFGMKNTWKSIRLMQPYAHLCNEVCRDNFKRVHKWVYQPCKEFVWSSTYLRLINWKDYILSYHMLSYYMMSYNTDNHIIPYRIILHLIISHCITLFAFRKITRGRVKYTS